MSAALLIVCYPLPSRELRCLRCHKRVSRALNSTLEASALSWAILETYVFTEVLKSWWNCGMQLQLYYYRDKDGKEIDLLLVQDRAMHPIEIRKLASPRTDWVRYFGMLDRLHPAWTQGAVICLCRELLPLG
jgi:uncharacterized protein